MKWLHILLASAAILVVGVVVVVVAFVHEPRWEPTPVPEPVAPVMLVEAFLLPDGGAPRVHLRDAAGHDFDFRLTKSEAEVHDERHNRLIMLDGNELRVIELRSAEEERLKRALVLAINDRRSHPTPTAPGDERSLMLAEAALERFAHLGKPWPY